MKKEEKQTNSENSQKSDSTEEPKEIKETETSDSTKEDLEQKTKQNKTIIIAIALMASVLLIMFLVPYIKHNYFNKFEYMRLDFQKTQLGDLYFYSTSIPVANPEATEVVGEYLMPYNRYDPRELDYIEVNTPYEKIMFKRDNKTIFVTLDPEMDHCPDNTIALSNLAGFLRDFAKYEIETAVSDEEYANSSKMNYVTCDTYPDAITLSITSGDKTEIRKRGGNCYILTYNNCEIIPVTEKFIWTVLKDYLKGFQKNK